MKIYPHDPAPVLPRRRLGGFTLIELLAVIAVIGVLGAILVPAIYNTRDKAKTATTVNNLRQLQVANMTYANMNGGDYVPLYAGDSPFSEGWKWNDRFLDYLGMQTPLTEAEKEAFRSGFWNENESRSLIGYSMYRTPANEHPWAANSAHTIKQSMIKNPTHLIAFIEANDWWASPYEFDNWESAAADDVSSTSNYASVAYRNNGKAAAVTFDGAVIFLGREDLGPHTPEGARRWFYDAD